MGANADKRFIGIIKSLFVDMRELRCTASACLDRMKSDSKRIVIGIAVDDELNMIGDRGCCFFTEEVSNEGHRHINSCRHAG